MNRAMLTTSWDDGNTLDFRIADMLAKYGLTGTFYIPRNAPTRVMGPEQVRDLSTHFEIGAHTLEHVFLTDVDLAQAEGEIAGSRQWVEQITGKACTLFCPPAGKFNHQHLRLILAAGFRGLRTVEFMSLDYPRPVDGLAMIPTTIQARSHPMWDFAKNFAKRLAWRNAWLWATSARDPLWHHNVRRLLQLTLARGGVFHLWGHSWEIEEFGQWDRLDYALRLMRDALEDAPCVTNSGLCGWSNEQKAVDALKT